MDQGTADRVMPLVTGREHPPTGPAPWGHPGRGTVDVGTV